MAKAKALEIIRALNNGVYRLECESDAKSSITLTFLQSGQFFWVVSAYHPGTKAVQILTGPEWRGNWQVRGTPSKSLGVGSLPSSSVSSLSSFGNWSGGGEASEKPGPYLILNFTDLSKCVLNFTIMGFPIHLGDWINHTYQLFNRGNYRVLDFAPDEMRLETPGGEIQLWQRANMVAPPHHHLPASEDEEV